MLCIKMKCPYCNNNETQVVDKRETKNFLVTRRRRECLKCKKRFTTYERVEIDLMVIKKDNRREPFDREKLKKGILRACEKRPISKEKIEKLIEEIESDLKKMKSNEIKSSVIGERVMKKLKSLDKVAYIRFASVYRDFKDVKDFEKEVKELK